LPQILTVVGLGPAGLQFKNGLASLFEAKQQGSQNKIGRLLINIMGLGEVFMLVCSMVLIQ